MQGVLPLLVGTGADDLQRRQVAGRHPAAQGRAGLLPPGLRRAASATRLQQEAKGRDKSFAEFAADKIGILLESDYFWRSVVEPARPASPRWPTGTPPSATR